MQTAMSGMKNQLMAEFLPSFTTIMNGLTEIFAGDTGTGVKIVKEGLQEMGKKVKEAMPKIFNAVKELVSGMLTLLVESLPEFLDMGFDIVGRLVKGLGNNLPQIISTVISMISKMLQTFISRLPEFLAMGVKLIVNLVSGLVKSIPQILREIGAIIKSMLQAFANVDWAKIGSDIINGIVNGIKKFGGKIGDTLKGYAKNAWESVKSFFKIGSPSKLMRDTIGRFIPEGVAVGIEANADSVTDAMEDLANMTVGAYSPDVTALGSSASGSTTMLGGVTININNTNGLDERKLAEKIGDILTEITIRKGEVYA